MDFEGYIFFVVDEKFLEIVNKSIFLYEWRLSNLNLVMNEFYIIIDFCMNLKYFGFGLGVKGIVFIFFIVVFIMFGCLIWFYGWEKFVVEEVIEDLDKVDGVVIEEVDFEIEFD